MVRSKQLKQPEFVPSFVMYSVYSSVQVTELSCILNFLYFGRGFALFRKGQTYALTAGGSTG